MPEGVWREGNPPPPPLSGKINQCIHSGEQYGGSVKHSTKKYQVTQPSHAWVWILRKPSVQKILHANNHGNTRCHIQDMKETEVQKVKCMGKEDGARTHKAALPSHRKDERPLPAAGRTRDDRSQDKTSITRYPSRWNPNMGAVNFFTKQIKQLYRLSKETHGCQK